MHESDLKALNALLDQLYFTESQIDVSDFCEFRLGITDIRLHRRYAQWLVAEGYARAEPRYETLLWITPKGRTRKEKGGIKLRDTKKLTLSKKELAIWATIIGGITSLIMLLLSILD